MTYQDGRNIGAQPLRNYRKSCGLALAFLTASSLAAVSACSEHSYPSPAVEQAPPAAPPGPPPALMGAPYPAPCAASAGPCDAGAAQGAPPVIASAPIPNPPEDYRRRRHEQIWTGALSHAHSHTPAAGGWHIVGPVVAAHKAVSIAKHAAAVAGAAGAAAVAQLHPQKPTPPPPPPKTAASAAPAPATNTTGNTTGEPVDKYTALQTALSNLVPIDAMLDTPPNFTANQTVDVSLTLSNKFAQEVHEEAVKAGLADATSAVNIQAHLAGTGYSVAPDQPQSQPLLLGQQTIFRWKVTPTSEASGPLKAELTADLLTASKSIPIGSVVSRATSGQISGRLIGIGLLVLLLLIVVGWLLRRRRAPGIRRRDI